MTKKSDFNDLASEAGHEAVRKTVEAAQQAAAAEMRQWEDPMMFNRIDTPELPAELLPGVFGEYAQALSDALQTPPTMAVLFELAVMSLCLQRKARVSPFGDDYSEPLSVWAVILADSGERKSALIQRLLKPVLLKEAKLAEAMRGEIVERDTVRKIAQRRAEKLQADAAKEDSAVRRGEIVREITELAEQTPDELRPPRFFTGDVTPERLQAMLVEHGGRMAVMSDEGGIFAVLAGLYSGGESVIDVALQAYSGSPVRVDRGSRTAVIDRPALAFGLGMQPGLLQDMAPAAKRKFRASGAFARFFFGLPASRIGKRDMSRRVTIQADLEARYRGEVLRLLEIEPRTDVAEGDDDEHVLLLSDQARELWVDFAQKIEGDQAEGGPLEAMRDWCAKLPGGALRVAGLLHIAAHGGAEDAISDETMQRAIGLCLRLIRHAQAVFDLIGADAATDDARVCWRWIERQAQPEFMRSDLHRAHHSRFDKIDRLIAALETLKTRNLITGPHKGTAAGGRPPIYYRVNPLAMKVAG
jgi:putative DNA primase/helicase